ncbi:MAG: 50S ribosome-binding GTPase, partial [Bacteroidia bacterium]|nr:50S ribosome-binding GTPase [Bacteroidia bacterium]
MKPAKTTNNNKQQPIKIALIGNPNCGKSSLFNVLTGLNQRTGNFSGVTVDRHIGEFNTNIGKYTLIDLPGTYSLTPKTPDELIAANVLVNKNNPDYPDLVLYVADALNLKRSLYLLTQIIDLGLPVVVAVNMIDLLEQESIPDFTLLSSCFKVPFVGISSIKKIGIDELKEKLILAKTPPTFFQPNFNRLTNLEINNPLTSYTDWINFQNKLSNEKDSLLQKNNQFRNFQVAEIADRYKKIDSLLQQANIQPP